MRLHKDEDFSEDYLLILWAKYSGLISKQNHKIIHKGSSKEKITNKYLWKNKKPFPQILETHSVDGE